MGWDDGMMGFGIVGSPSGIPSQGPEVTLECRHSIELKSSELINPMWRWYIIS